VRLERVGAGVIVVHPIEERLVPVCSPRFVTRHGTSMSAVELVGAPLLHYSPAPADWRRWTRHWFGGPFDVEQGEVIDMVDHALQGANAGQGIAMTDLSMIETGLALGHLALWSNEVIPNEQAYGLVVRDPAPIRPALAYFAIGISTRRGRCLRQRSHPNALTRSGDSQIG